MDNFGSFESLVIQNEVINEGLMSKTHIQTPVFEAMMTMMTLGAFQNLSARRDWLSGFLWHRTPS